MIVTSVANHVSPPQRIRARWASDSGGRREALEPLKQGFLAALSRKTGKEQPLGRRPVPLAAPLAWSGRERSSELWLGVVHQSGVVEEAAPLTYWSPFGQ